MTPFTKKVTSDEVKKRLLDVWPHMRTTVRLYDLYYTYPTYEEVKDAMAQCPRYKKIPYMDYISDCDKKSLWLNADIKEFCAIKTKLSYTWTFGIISGFVWNGVTRNHTGNIFLTKNEIFIVDSSDFSNTWPANPKKDFMIEVRL